MTRCARFVIRLACWWCGALALVAGFPRHATAEPKRFTVDLTGDAAPETITCRKVGAKAEIGTFYQVVVKDSAGAILWKSAETLDSNDPLAFGEWHFGISMPEFVGDVDDDGRPELVASAPQSDVSPAFFRVFKWVEGGFRPAFSKALMGKAEGGAVFRWTGSPAAGEFWVQHWVKVQAGIFTVEVVTLSAGGDVTAGTARLLPRGQDFVFGGWVRPPGAAAGGEPERPPAEVGALSYRARLSAADHRNSSGTALDEPVQILRQDRANVHSGRNRDPDDEADAAFATVEGRERLSTLPLTVRGGAEGEADIVRGTPLVEVTVTDRGVTVRILQP